MLERNGIPFFAKKGWTRPKENVAKHPLKEADGVVVSSYRLSISNGFDNRWLETTTPSALNKERGRSFLRRSRPFFAKKGITFCQPDAFVNHHKSMLEFISSNKKRQAREHKAAGRVINNVNLTRVEARLQIA